MTGPQIKKGHTSVIKTGFNCKLNGRTPLEELRLSSEKPSAEEYKKIWIETVNGREKWSRVVVESKNHLGLNGHKTK